MAGQLMEDSDMAGMLRMLAEWGAYRLLCQELLIRTTTAEWGAYRPSRVRRGVLGARGKMRVAWGGRGSILCLMHRYIGWRCRQSRGSRRGRARDTSAVGGAGCLLPAALFRVGVGVHGRSNSAEPPAGLHGRAGCPNANPTLCDCVYV